jgi:hypothetical protein
MMDIHTLNARSAELVGVGLWLVLEPTAALPKIENCSISHDAYRITRHFLSSMAEMNGVSPPILKINLAYLGQPIACAPYGKIVSQPF